MENVRDHFKDEILKLKRIMEKYVAELDNLLEQIEKGEAK